MWNPKKDRQEGKFTTEFTGSHSWPEINNENNNNNSRIRVGVVIDNILK